MRSQAQGDAEVRATRRPPAAWAAMMSAMVRSLFVWLAMASLAATAFAQIPGDSLVLEGDYIQTGVSNNGTLGVGGNTHPGFIFDATGTGSFISGNDYLTPGSPFEGFSISYAGGGILKNNNTGTFQIGSAAAPTVVDSMTSGYDNAVVWSGTVDGVFSVEHLYGLNTDAKRVEITTTITALMDLDDVTFARYIDPDSGGTSSINSRGNATLGLAPEDWVNSESETNGATLGLFSDSDVTHNTAITSPWSTDPDDYLAGSPDSIGDDAIGIGFDIGDLLTGESITFIYSYAVAADANDFDLGGGTMFAASVLTPNQFAVATFLDDNSVGAPAGLQDVIDELTPLTDAQLQAAMNQFSGAIYGSLPVAGLQHTSYYLAQIAGHLRGGLALRPAATGLTWAAEAPAVQLASYFEDELIAPAQSCWCERRDAWISGYGLGGAAQSDGNADGFQYGVGGTQFAVERPLSECWNAGLWGNLAWSRVAGRELNETATIGNYHFGGYLTGFDGEDYYIAIGGLGYDHGDVQRQLGVGGIASAAQGRFDGWQANAYLERGLVLCRRGWDIRPYGALQYVYLRQGELTETGADALNLAVGGLDVHSLRCVLGGRLARTTTTRRGRLLTPELRAAWLHEFLDTNQVISAGLAEIGGAGFAVSGVDLGRDWATAGLAVQLQANACTRLFASYDVQFNEYQTFHVGSAGLEVVW